MTLIDRSIVPISGTQMAWGRFGSRPSPAQLKLVLSMNSCNVKFGVVVEKEEN